jgi:hypothetical protein
MQLTAVVDRLISRVAMNHAREEDKAQKRKSGERIEKK